MRYYYLDALRSVLMMLGVLYHAALIYSGTKWRVIDRGETTFLFDALIEFNSWFRMPAFFIIAGFFTQFSLQRHGARAFLKTRAMRILIPLFVTTLTVNVAMNYLYPFVAGVKVAPLLMVVKLLPRSFAAGNLTGHLWFLQNLFFNYLLYLALAWLIEPFSANRQPPWEPLRPWLARRDPSLVILLLALFHVGMAWFSMTAPKVYTSRLFGLFEFNRTLWMFSYFLFGVWFYQSTTIAQSFCRFQVWHGMALLLAYAILKTPGLAADFGLGRLTLAYCRGIVTWTLCLACFAGFKRVFDRPSKIWSYLSDASYTAYLFHMFFVVLIGAWLKHFQATPALKYPLLVLATFAGTLLVHHFVILRFRIFRLLYNGKWASRKPAPPPAKDQEPREPEALALTGSSAL